MAANSRDLIKDLRDGFENIQHRDYEGMNRLKTRGDMLIRRIFGESSHYAKTWSRIRYKPQVYPADAEYHNSSWKQGRSRAINLIDTMLAELDLFEPEDEAHADRVSSSDVRDRVPSPDVSDRVFVVHGHDGEMKSELARVLANLGLRPVILHEQPDEGKTIIEKFTDYSDVGFAVVLLSPDDVGYARDGAPSDAKPRARQNVVFELGYFVGKLGRPNVLALIRKHDGDFEIPSDLSGVLYTEFVEGRWQRKLVQELQASGYDVSADDLP